MKPKFVALSFLIYRKPYLFGWCAFALVTPLFYHYSRFSHLDIISVAQKGRTIQIAGTTDLPDDTVLLLDLNSEPPTKTRLEPEKLIWVKNHHYSGQITIPPTFSMDPHLYSLKVFYTPVFQSKQVQAEIGNKGQNVSGSLSYRLNGINFLAVKYRLAQAEALFHKPT